MFVFSPFVLFYFFLAYKLKELKCVRFKRLSEDKLPTHITSTLGGTDQYLKEIRNIVESKKDVSKIWDCDPRKIKILGIDLGQACVVGASAILPDTDNSLENPNSGSQSQKMVYHNLSVKQKAVYQPIFKFRRWLENRRNTTHAGEETSIADDEGHLPPVRGVNSSIESYFEKFKEVGGKLSEFYSDERYLVKRHLWDTKRARDLEFQRVADSLFKLVGGSLGQKRDDSNKVVIGVGLGKFSSRIRLTSLHGSFMSYFIQKVNE
jgi:hypothetical protein